MTSGGVLWRQRRAAGEGVADASSWWRFAGGSGAASAVGVVLLIIALAAAQGGYYANSWSWTALVAAWVVAVVAVVGRPLLEKLDVALIIGLALLLVWTVASLAWTSSASATWDELQRTLAYLLVVAAALITVSRRRAGSMQIAIWAAISLVSAYSLATRLFPNWLAIKNSYGGVRLADPIGYWNGLGLFAAIGVLLATGFAAHSSNVVLRGLAAASLPISAAALYFTFSRGAWLALAIGLLVAIAVDSRRLRLVTAVALFALPCGVALLAAYRSSALTHTDSTVAAAAHDGHHLAVVVAASVLLAVALATFLDGVQARWSPGRRLRRAYGAALGALLVGAVATVIAAFGSPATIARNAWRAFDRPPPTTGTNLNNRLFQFSGNRRSALWRVAWRDGTTHAVTGSGAGTFENEWLKARTNRDVVRDAHNLYLETFAELGSIGAILLLAVLATPLIALARARKQAFVPAAAGAYVAYLAHAAVDWDWELPAVTLAALLCGATLVASARREDGDGSRTLTWARWPVAGAAVAFAAFAFVGAVGNTAASHARVAALHGNWHVSAQQASKATDWLPWSADPWRMLGEAQLALRQPQAAGTLRKAAAKDPNDWLTWFDLAAATTGAEQRKAVLRARRLNPLDPDIKELYGR